LQETQLLADAPLRESGRQSNHFYMKSVGMVPAKWDSSKTQPNIMKNNQQTNSRKNGENKQGKQEADNMNEELHELFLDELADLLSAETQLTKALPKMAKAAQSEDLREAFESHLVETEGHVERLKQVFAALGEKPKSKTCKAMKGLVEEGSEIMEEQKGTSVIDAGLIAAAQKVEHYEIASYGTVRAWAEQMGHSEAVSLLDETLAEENAADEKLTEIAEESANVRSK
jgi:ferritin-like metal-binding protein YciE